MLYTPDRELIPPHPTYEVDLKLKDKAEEAFELWQYSQRRRKAVEDNTKYYVIFENSAKHIKAINFQLAVERRCYLYYKAKEKEYYDSL